MSKSAYKPDNNPSAKLLQTLIKSSFEFNKELECILHQTLCFFLSFCFFLGVSIAALYMFRKKKERKQNHKCWYACLSRHKLVHLHMCMLYLNYFFVHCFVIPLNCSLLVWFRILHWHLFQ